MSGLAKLDDQYVPLQITVFTRWVNTQLKGVSDHELSDITKDLSNGVQLVQLAQVLTGKEAPRAWSKNPTNNYDQVTNCDLAIQMFENDGVQFVGISGKDVNDNNEKLILGLIWTLILKYSIAKSVAKKDANGEEVAQSNKNNKDALMNWAQEHVAASRPDMKNFKNYDVSMCALLDSYAPGRIDMDKLNPDDPEGNTKIATDVMNDLGIPVYIYPEDVAKNGNQVDEKTLLTQLSSAKVVLDNLPPEVLERGINTDAAEAERLQREKEEQERKEKEEQERKEKEEQERLAKEKEEQERKEREEQERKEREEKERIAREQAEAERLAKEKEEQEHREREEQERREREEQERKEREEQERLAREQAEQERLAKEKEEQERLAKQQAEAARLAKQRDAAKGREDDLNNLKSIVEQLRQNLSNVQSQVDDANNKANAATQKVEDLSNENAHLRKDNKCLKYEIKKLKEDPSEPSTRAVQFTSDDVNRMKGDADDTKNTASKLKAENDQMKQTIEKHNGDLKVLKYEVKKLKGQAAAKPDVSERAITVNDINVDQIKGDVENTKNSTSQLQAENEQMKQTIQQMQSQINDLTSQIQSIPAQNVVVPDEFVQKINDAEEHSNKAFQKANEVSQNIESIKKQSNDVNNKVSDLVSANDKLNKDMKCMKFEVKKLKDSTEEKEVPQPVETGPEIPDDLIDRVNDAKNKSKLANEEAELARTRASRANEKADGAGSKADEAIHKADLLRVENDKFKNDIRCLKYEIKKMKTELENNGNKNVVDTKQNA